MALLCKVSQVFMAAAFVESPGTMLASFVICQLRLIQQLGSARVGIRYSMQ